MRRRLQAVCGATTVALLLVGCGGAAANGESGRSADQVVKDAVAALKSAHSFHMNAKVNAGVAGGAAGFSGALTVDVVVVPGSGSSAGTLENQGITAHFVYTGGKFYLQGRKLFAKFAGEQAANLFGDRWVIVPPVASGSFTSFGDVNSLASCLMPATGNSSKGTATVDGQSTIVVFNQAANTTMYVAASGTPYPVRVQSGGTSSPTPASTARPTGAAAGCGSANLSSGTATFSNFDAASSITPPPDPVNLSGLAG
jgi:hypothetical protein